jgi:hypothetical protein
LALWGPAIVLAVRRFEPGPAAIVAFRKPAAIVAFRRTGPRAGAVLAVRRIGRRIGPRAAADLALSGPAAATIVAVRGAKPGPAFGLAA